jgi:ankyrin repeat protein
MKGQVVSLIVAAVLASAAAQAADSSTLLSALESGDHATALHLLEQGGDARAVGVDGTTTLMWAAHYGDAELARRLIKGDADVNAVNHYGASALSEAATLGSTPVIEALLEGGVDVTQANPEGETALMEVARTGNIEAAKLLLKAGADINAKESWGGQSALMWAAAESQPEMVKFLVSKGADVDARGAVRDWQRRILKEPRPKDMNHGGFTPLLYAAREGCIECARYLVEGGADIDLADPERVTPLCLALENLHFDVAAYLIEAGADIDKWDLFGRTPLYQAVDMNTLPVQGNGAMSGLPSMDKHTALDIMSMLLDKGADPNIRLKRRPPYRNVPQDRGGDRILSVGATPLLRAARAGDAPAVKLLLEHGALVDLPSKEGVTPFMAAAGVEFGQRVTRGRNRTDEGVLATLQLLFDAGADVNARMVVEPKVGNPYSNYTSAARKGNYRFDVLGRQVPSPRAVPDQAAIHGAAMRGFNSVIQFLAAHGADLEAKDSQGRTAMDYAEGRYTEDFLRHPAEPNEETVKLLKSLMAAQSAPARELSSANVAE